MDFVLTTGTGAIATVMLVAMFKLSYPTAASYLVVLVCVLSGVAMSFLVEVGQGHPMTAQNVAVTVIAGIFAAATASGVRGADNKADEKRANAGPPQ